MMSESINLRELNAMKMRKRWCRIEGFVFTVLENGIESEVQLVGSEGLMGNDLLDQDVESVLE